jgi:hypothetical protein
VVVLNGLEWYWTGANGLTRTWEFILPMVGILEAERDGLGTRH